MSEAPIPYDVGPDRFPSGRPFRNQIPVRHIGFPVRQKHRQKCLYCPDCRYCRSKEHWCDEACHEGRCPIGIEAPSP